MGVNQDLNEGNFVVRDSRYPIESRFIAHTHRGSAEVIEQFERYNYPFEIIQFEISSILKNKVILVKYFCLLNVSFVKLRSLLFNTNWA